MKEKVPKLPKGNTVTIYKTKKYIVVDCDEYCKTECNTIEEAKRFCKEYMKNTNWKHGKTWFIFPVWEEKRTKTKYGKCVGHFDIENAREWR